MSASLSKLLVLALCATALLAALPAGAADSITRHYVGAGTIVVRSTAPASPGTPNQVTIVDNGAVTCRDSNGDGSLDAGTGGVCIPFAELTGDSVYAHDGVTPDSQLAFQVCLDTNGNGICGGPSTGPGCEDLIVFSHGRAGTSNPLYVNPTFARSFWQSCGKLGFPGFIVILCAGAHEPDLALPHDHVATQGDVRTVTGGGPSGEFCGGSIAAKAYAVV